MQVSYTTTADGLSIAWRRSGKGQPLVLVPNLITRLDYDSSCPVWENWDAFLEQRFDYVRYDMRGSGRSDRRTIRPPDGNTWIADLEAVIDTAGISPPFILVGWSQGLMTAVDYATRYPDNVSKLILYSGSATGGRLHSRQEVYEIGRTLPALAVSEEKPAFMTQFISSILPDATPARHAWLKELILRSYTAEAATAFFETIERSSVQELLARLTIPVLVLSSRDDGVFWSVHSEATARATPGAELVLLDSSHHIIDRA